MGEFLFAVCVAFVVVGVTTRRRRLSLQDRALWPVEDLVKELVQRSGLGVPELAEAWRQLARDLGVEPERLRADDKLDRLAVLPGWLAPWDRGAWTPTGMLLDRLRRDLGPDADCSGLQTVGDYVLVTCDPQQFAPLAQSSRVPSATSYGCGGCLLGGVGAALPPALLVLGLDDQALGEIYIAPPALLGMVVGMLLGSRAWEEKYGPGRPDDLVLQPPAQPPADDAPDEAE